MSLACPRFAVWLWEDAEGRADSESRWPAWMRHAPCPRPRLRLGRWGWALAAWASAREALMGLGWGETPETDPDGRLVPICSRTARAEHFSFTFGFDPPNDAKGKAKQSTTAMKVVAQTPTFAHFRVRYLEVRTTLYYPRVAGPGVTKPEGQEQSSWTGRSHTHTHTHRTMAAL